MDFIEPKDRLIEDLEQKIIFIPLFNFKKEFLEYTYTELDNKEKIIPHIPFHLVNNHGKKYASSSVLYLSMHEIIFGSKAPIGFKIDHANSNGLDNRRINLRLATNGQNCHNRVKLEGWTSEYYGVCKASKEKKWIASITFNREHHYLGAFENVLDAVKIHDIYAVYFYKECARLNVDKEGNYFITPEEIEDIYLNGIPEKYKRLKREKDRDLPPCILELENSWVYRKRHNYVTYRKKYKTLEEAEEGLKELEEKIEKMKNEEKEEKEKNITRNEDGVAILYTYDKNREINGEWPVDDHVWKIFVHYNWSKGEYYAHGYIDGIVRALHDHVYRYFVGDIPEGMTVDHVKSWDKNDTRLSNLRLASKSLQAHNTIRSKRSILRYKGISISSGKFSLKYKTKYIGTYFYEEDAKLEYNRLATLDYGKDAALIEITDTKTTALDYFNNLTLDFLEEIETVYETKEVFRNHPIWMKKHKVLLHQINSETYPEYLKLAIEILKKELEEGETVECIDSALNEKITLEYIKNAKTVKTVKEIFRTRHDWKTQHNVHFNKITTITLPYYIDLAFEIKKKELAETRTHTLDKNPSPKSKEISEPRPPNKTLSFPPQNSFPSIALPKISLENSDSLDSLDSLEILDSLENSPKITNTPTLKIINTPTLKITNTPTLKIINTPTLKIINTPTLKITNTPTLKIINTLSI